MSLFWEPAAIFCPVNPPVGSSKHLCVFIKLPDKFTSPPGSQLLGVEDV